MLRPKTIFCLTLTLSLMLTLGFICETPPVMAAGEVVKVGVFDLQRAINKSRKGQAAKNKLSSKFQRYQQELKSKEGQLERLQKQIEAQATALSPAALREKRKELARQVRDFQDKYRDYTEEMQREEMERTKPMISKLLETASSIGKERGYSLIIEVQKAGVIYAPDALDITDEVIRRFDASQ